MKKYLIFIFLLPALAFAQTQTAEPAKQADANAPVFKFNEETFDFGSLPQGTPVTHIFTYTNTGKSPLILSQATASCGCTTPSWTKEPVAPGKTGTVSVTFNAAKDGTFMKTVTLLSNTGNAKYIYIKGNVIAKANPNGEENPKQ
ncbi:MAG: DUF1573 domain-containing protein [Chitinophagales bacterium]|nr:DUF1573 domain-containing protein [Chitinophagales bacterium]